MTGSGKYNLDGIRQALFTSLFAFPVLPLKITNALFIVFALVVVFLFVQKKPGFIFKEFSIYLIIILPFIPYLIEFLLYHTNTIIQFELEKKLLFFFAPVVFYLNSKLKGFQLRNALLCFVMSMSFMAAISLLYLVLSGVLFSDLNYQHGAYGLRSAFEDFSGLHPTYFALFATTASLWIFYYLDNFKGRYKTIIILCLFFLILSNLLIASKMPLLILGIGFLWLAYVKIKNKMKLATLYFSFFGSFVVLMFFIPSLRSRLLEVQNFFISETFGNTLTERMVIFHCGRSVFLSEIVTGIGARNVQGIMDYCYVWFGFHKGALIHLNPHNQYLSLGIAYGIGILLLFLAGLFLLFRRIKNAWPARLFLFSLLLIMTTESVLERQMGVYYYLLFSALFLLQSREQQEVNTSAAT